MRSKTIVVTVLSLACLAGCGSSAPSATAPTGAGSTSATGTPTIYTTISKPQITVADTVPAPVGDPVLTLTGNIGITNTATGLAFDLASLERVGLVEYPMNDPQAEGRTATFRGVLLSQLLEVAHVPASATSLHAIAINDYAVDIPLSDVRTMPVMLATSVDGQRMSVERFGPTRVVYPMDQLKLKRAVYDARLIWQLKSLEVR